MISYDRVYIRWNATDMRQMFHILFLFARHTVNKICYFFFPSSQFSFSLGSLIWPVSVSHLGEQALITPAWWMDRWILCKRHNAHHIAASWLNKKRSSSVAFLDVMVYATNWGVGVEKGGWVWEMESWLYFGLIRLFPSWKHSPGLVKRIRVVLCVNLHPPAILSRHIEPRTELQLIQSAMLRTTMKWWSALFFTPTHYSQNFTFMPFSF